MPRTRPSADGSGPAAPRRAPARTAPPDWAPSRGCLGWQDRRFSLRAAPVEQQRDSGGGEEEHDEDSRQQQHADDIRRGSREGGEDDRDENGDTPALEDR